MTSSRRSCRRPRAGSVPPSGSLRQTGILNPLRCHVERYWFLPGGITEISEPDLPQRVSIEPVTCAWQIEAKRLSKPPSLEVEKGSATTSNRD
jgi:hypothetical protein